MTTPQFQRVEGGLTNATLTTLGRLADGFGVDVGDFVAPDAARTAGAPGPLCADGAFVGRLARHVGEFARQRHARWLARVSAYDRTAPMTDHTRTPPGRSGPLADDPIDLPAQDLLARGPYAERVVRVLEHTRAQTRSSVLALLGPWGSGKSSVLNLVVAALRKQDHWTIVEFNPWEAADVGALMVNFFDAILDALPADEKGESSTRRALARFARRAVPMGSASAVGVGIDLGKLAAVAAHALEDRSPSARRRAVESTLANLSQPVVVVMDDLDRLHPSELLTVMKLVRLLGRLPNLYYLLAFDEGTVLDVLTRTEIAHDDPDRALAYLEKIVQVRLDLPPVHARHASAMTHEALDGVLARSGVALSERARERMTQLFERHLRRRLNEPRSIKRFAAQLEAYLPLVAGEVDPVDFVAVTYLRTFFPDVYRRVSRDREDLVGVGWLDARPKDSDAQKAAHERWRGRVAQAVARADDVEHVHALLAWLFPRVALGFGTSVTFRAVEALAREQRVGSADYFDRYFQLAVPPGDLPDATIRALSDELAAGRPAHATDAVTRGLRDEPVLTLERIAAVADQLPPGERVELVAFLATHYERIPEVRTGSTSPRTLAREIAASILGDVGDASARLENRPVGSLDFVVWVLARAAGEYPRTGRSVPPALARLRAAWAEKLRAQLEADTGHPLFEVPDRVRLLHAWRELAGADVVQTWLRAALVSTSWTVADLAAFSVRVWSGRGGPDLWGLDLDELGSLVSIDWVIDQLAAELDALPEDGGGEDEDASLPNRRRRALSALRETRDERRAAAAAIGAPEPEPA